MTAVDSQSIIISNEWVNNEYKHLVVYVGEKSAIAEPGQFFNILCPQTQLNKPFFRRPMSTYFVDRQKGTVEFLYKIAGSGTQNLATLKPNDPLSILGPLGKGFTLKEHYRHILVIGRGVGLATLAPLAESAAQKGIKITAILSARHKASLMSQARFLNIGAEVIEVVDTDDSSNVHNVRQLILNKHYSQPFDSMFTCGSTRITKLLQQLANELNIEGEVALEQQMACGLGMCYCCIKPFKDTQQNEIKSKRVCIDGPVFDIKEVVF